MNPLFNVLALGLLVAQFGLPRRFGFLPLMLAALHMPNMHIMGLGAYDFTITRLLLVAGLARAALAGHLKWSLRHPLDALFGLFAIIALLSSFGHEIRDSNPLVFRLGLVLNVIGTYLYARSYLSDGGSFVLFAKCLVVVLLPLAFLMAMEHASGQNPYSILGARENAMVREDRVRAQGPFAHPILAGTAGATLLPIALALWREHRKLALCGIAASTLITVNASSSGPVMTLFAALAGLGLWRWRSELSRIRKAVICALIGLHIVMQAPVWYLMARVDIVGGSTGSHRARLISAAVEHLNEWWFVGTDYTRHWMPSGVTWSNDHTDITNYYIKLGVIGGLPLMLSLIAILAKAFQLLGRRMIELRKASDANEFILWTLGASLFAHTITCLGVSYFDQVAVLFYLAIGVVPGLCIQPAKTNSRATEPQEAMEKLCPTGEIKSLPGLPRSCEA